MGRVEATGKQFNDKPVKCMVYDRSSRMLSVSMKSKKSIISHDRLMTYAALGLGVILLIAAVGLLII